MIFNSRIALALSLCTLAVAPTAQSKPAAKAKAAPRVQNVTIVVDSSGYHPSIVNVKAGRPVRMVFVSKGSGCANWVVIPALNKKFRLRLGQTQAVSWTPRKGQSVGFACDMDMFQGKVSAK